MTELLSQEEVLRYSRHLLMPNVGLEGQRKLKAASVLVVGTGGLGSPIALYLAAAGVGRIGLVDYDVVDTSNLQRQVIHSTPSVGMLKVESARARMLELNPHITVEPHNVVLQAGNAEQVAEGYDILVDGTDNFPTRYLLNDLAVLTGRPYVYGSIFRFEGQVSVFDARTGPCYRCLFPEPPPPHAVPSCSTAGVLGVLPGTVGSLQSAEVFKLILGIGKPLTGRLLLYDALEVSFRTVNLRKNPRCAICGENPSIQALIDYEEFCGVPARPILDGSAGAGLDITPSHLAEQLSNGAKFVLVDVRDPVEQQVSVLPEARIVAWDRVVEGLKDVSRDTPLVLFCRTGDRSARAVLALQKAGYRDVRNLLGGINAWSEQIDPSILRY